MTLANGMELTAPGKRSFRFDAGTLCLELLVTGGEGELAQWERLHTPGDLAAWIPHSRAGLGDLVQVSAGDLAATLRLRAALQRLASAAASGSRAFPAADLATLNEAAAAPPPVPVIGPALERSWASPVTGAQFLSAVARDAVEVFGGPALDRIRTCGGERCSLLFLDTSRPGARRWCSMDRCGNRHKLRTRRDRHPAG
ncbi:CGNR zinc finger domain-containing protein [Streptosporangium sp. NPDC002524]|uniref:CGNR zinc finger domain-containing protein n=1 Tax=Streptosporangium sp. NPDC002524 TaxID=3154537 RepID=UPI003327A08E